MTKIISREEYQQQIGGIRLGENNCPFCSPNEKINKLVWKGKYWNIMVNISPYTGDEFHIMATPVKHKVFFHELDNDELLELKNVYIFVREYFGEKNYFSTTRETFSNRSVEHYHIHFICGKLQETSIIEMLKDQNNN